MSIRSAITNRVEHKSIRGVGIGLRSPHYQHILNNQPKVSWLEVISDNYLSAGGLPLHYLERVRDRYPVTLHGVGMSLGSSDPLNLEYLGRLKRLAERVQPAHISDHLASISVGGHYLNDLVPLVYTEKESDRLVERILQAQDFLDCRILIENPSPYITFTDSTMPEWEFVREVVEKADCYLLLDVNNVYVSAINHGFDPLQYLDRIPPDRVKEIHLAGYEEKEDYLFDTHGYPVRAPVWELYREAIARFGKVPTLIEWDTDIPAFEVLVAEANKAEECWQKIG